MMIFIIEAIRFLKILFNSLRLKNFFNIKHANYFKSIFSCTIEKNFFDWNNKSEIGNFYDYNEFKFI